MTPAEQRAFDLMQKALREVLLCVPNAQKVTLLVALSAANAVQPQAQDEGVCKGAWELGTACGTCSKCIATEPAGYKLVPANATPEMIAAAEQVEDLYRRGTPHTWGSVYRAMLSAAPEEKKNG